MKIKHGGSEVADHITLSLGVNTIAPGMGDELKAFIEKADQTLYLAKNAGRNQSMGAITPSKLTNPENDKGKIKPLKLRN